MREKVNKIIKKKTLLFRSVLILSIIFVFGVSARIVYSNSQFNIKIKYLEDEFAPENNMDNNLFFNASEESTISFEVDFSSYYEGVKDKFQSNEQIVDPFEVVAELNKNTLFAQDIDLENNINIEKVISNNIFEGKYTVDITVPAGDNGESVDIIIEAIENEWEIDNEPKEEFSIIRDLENPEIEISGIRRDLSLENDKVIVEIEDEYKATGDINVNIPNDGVLVNKIKNDDELSHVEITVSKDGDYTGTITAKDKAGNESEGDIEFYVNKSAPTIKINDEDIKEVYTNGNITIKAVDDSKIDFNKSQYSLRNINNNSRPVTQKFTKIDEKTAEIKPNITEEGKYELDITVFDVKGKSSTADPKPIVIVDTVVPKVTIEGVNKDKVEYYNEDQTVIFKIEDKNLKEITLNGKTIDKSELKQDRQNKDLYTYEYKTEVAKDKSEKFNLNIIATDEAGLKSDVQSISFVVDKKKPTTEFIGVKNNEYYKTDKNVTIKVSDDNLDNEKISAKVIKYSIDNKSIEIPVNKFTNGELTIPFNEDGKYTIEVNGSDQSGNPIDNKANTIIFTIDKTPPIVNIKDYETFNGSFNKEVDSVNFSVNEVDFERKDLEVNITKTKVNSKPETFKAEENNIKELSKGNGIYEFELVNIFEDEGKYDISINLTDKAANSMNTTSINKVSFTVDRTNPTVEFLDTKNNSKLKNGDYYKADKDITIKVKDENLKDENIIVEAKRYASDSDTKGTDIEIGKFNNGISQTTFKENGKYIIKVNGKDNSDNTIDDGNIEFIIDKIAPIVDIQNHETLNGSFNKKVDSVKFSVNEADFERKDLKVNITKTKVNSKPDTFEVEDKNLKELSRNNGSYEFELVDLFKDEGKYNISINLTDKAGNSLNTISKNSVSFTVDNTKPTIEFLDTKSNSKLENDSYHKTYKDVTIKVTDENLNDSNINVTAKRYANTIDRDNDKNGIDVKIGEFSNGISKTLFKDEGVYTIKVTGKDNSDNEIENGNITFTIDKTLPKVNIENYDDLTDSFKEEVKSVKVKIDELNFDKDKLKVAITKVMENGKRDPMNLTDKDIVVNEVSKENGEYEVVIGNAQVFEAEVKYHLYVDITDAANNPMDKNNSKYEVLFTLDKTAPKIDVKGVDDEKYYKDDVQFSTTITDTNHKTNTITVTKNDGPYQVGEFSEKDKERKLDHKFTQEGKYKITIESEDKAGNKAEPENIEFTIDKKKPELKITDESDKDIESGKFYDKFKDIHIELTDDNFESYILKINGEEEKFNKDKNDSTTLTYDFKADKDRVYEVAVNAKDMSGNNLTENGEPKITTFVIDTTKPIVNIEGFDGLNGSFNKKVDSVKVNINEINFDKNNLKVNLKVTEPNKETKTTVIEGKNIEVQQLKDENGTPIAGKYEFVLNNLFTLDAKYDISVEMTDIVGNPIDESSKNAVSFTVDNTIPDIKVVTPGDKKYYKDAELPLEVRVKDNNHNTNIITIEKISKKVGEEAKVEKKDYTNFVAEGSDQVFRTSFKDEGTYNISVYSKDKATNENKLKEIYSFVIDRTQPSIVTNFSSINETYSNPQKNAYIKVSEVNWKNQYTGKALIASVKGEKITPDNKATSIDLSFPLTGEVTEVNYGNEFADDAIYNLNVSISDSASLAGNAQSVKFTTDKTTPTISIEGVENDQYYNMDRYLVIKNNDVNHNINTISIKRNGNAYPIGDFATEGRDKIAKHTFTQEGEYEVSVTSTDKSGNNVVHPTIKFTVDKTAPVITPLNRNENKVLQNGQYINKLFIPEFRLDKPEDDKIDLISLNGEGNFANSTLMADKETEYKYKVVASDKAKNTSNLDIGFTVDVTLPEVKISGILSGFFSKDMRPVYDISDKNLDKEKTSVTLNGQPFKSGTTIEEQDNYNLKLIGTDLANNVVTKTIGFTIDKDKPVIKFEEAISGQYFTEDFIPNFVIDDLTDYTIISMTLNGEDYEVGQPIEKEGKHVLYIEVKDKAENIESVSVEFILDKTPPKFIIDGVEEDGRYTEAVSAVIKLDNPSDTIKAVEVNGEIAKGDIKDEDGQEVVTVDFNEIKPYELKLTAVDAAGNLTEETINFEVVEKNVFVKLYQNKPVFYPVVIVAVGAVISIAFIIFKKSKKKNEEQDNEVNE